MEQELAFETFTDVWGHPARWPSPFRRKPSFFSFRQRRDEKQMLDVIKSATGIATLTDEMRSLYWGELRKGQDVHEDAGGYFERAYAVMLGFRQPALVRTYADVIAENRN